MERTLVIIKPDAVQRHLVGEVISRFEKKGLKIVGAKFIQISDRLARQLYSVHEGQPYFERQVNFMSSGPVLAIVLKANNAISIVRKVMGATFGFNAKGGTIRGDFSCSEYQNLVHGSDSVESAENEIAILFDFDEIIDYELSNDKWIR